MKPRPHTTYAPMYPYMKADRQGVAYPTTWMGREYLSLRQARKHATHEGSTILVREYGRMQGVIKGFGVKKAYELPV